MDWLHVALAAVLSWMVGLMMGMVFGHSLKKYTP